MRGCGGKTISSECKNEQKTTNPMKSSILFIINTGTHNTVECSCCLIRNSKREFILFQFFPFPAPSVDEVPFVNPPSIAFFNLPLHPLLNPPSIPLFQRETKGDLNPPQPSFKKGGRPVGTKGDFTFPFCVEGEKNFN